MRMQNPGNPLLEVLSKGERTRLHILDCSMKCFAEKGYEGANFTELSKAADVARGLIVHYFKTKKNLTEETLRYAGALLRSYTNEKMESRTDVSDPVERYVEVCFSWVKDHTAC